MVRVEAAKVQPPFWEISLIDAHAHLSSELTTGVVDDLVAGLRLGGIRHVMLGGYDPSDWRRQESLKTQYPDFVTICAGIHPWVIRDSEETHLKKMFCDLQDCAQNFDMMGEVGFDFYKDNSGRQKLKQMTWCSEQLSLASALGKPVVLHVVRGHDLMLQALNKYPKVSGLVHAFSGSSELAKEYVKRGFTLSVGSKFFIKKRPQDLQWLKGLPVVVESDAPHRGSSDGKPASISSLWLNVLEEAYRALSDVLEISQEELQGVVEERLKFYIRPNSVSPQNRDET